MDPGAAGENGQSLLENYHFLLNRLYDSNCSETATRSLSIGGVAHEVAPWFDVWHKCTEARLQRYGGQPETPKLGTDSAAWDFLVNGDEISELAVVASLGRDESRMRRIVATFDALKANRAAPYTGLPCWIGRVRNGSLTCLEGPGMDTATDVTARFGLSFFQGARNPSFGAPFRQLLLSRASALLDAHLAREYVNDRCLVSSATGQTVCHWVAGGVNTALGNPGLAGARMFTGYYQDVLLFLLAGFSATGSPAFLQRAEEVADQFLTSTGSQVTGTTPIFLCGGFKEFSWAVNGDVATATLAVAWEVADAPRIFAIGQSIRAFTLIHGLCTGTPLPGVWQHLAGWLSRAGAAQPDTPVPSSCVKFDALCNGANCYEAYFNNGLAAGLFLTPQATTRLSKYVRNTLTHYRWAVPCKGWDHDPNNPNDEYSCFGVYGPVRAMKSLAFAIGIDAPTYALEALRFYTLAPCRVVDTRGLDGPTGGPVLPANTARRFPLAGICGIPQSASAVVLNATALHSTMPGALKVYAAGLAEPISTVTRFSQGQTRATFSTLGLGSGGALDVIFRPTTGSGEVHVVLDVSGYFAP